jgi:hypothetical protein
MRTTPDFATGSRIEPGLRVTRVNRLDSGINRRVRVRATGYPPGPRMPINYSKGGLACSICIGLNGRLRRDFAAGRGVSEGPLSTRSCPWRRAVSSGATEY